MEKQTTAVLLQCDLYKQDDSESFYVLKFTFS
ncbi:hypothetical protein T05_1765 [Trichinella murrelli]|uniref:Uncharacterized protein n=1 Tax=Trichinella murrelli TaxID=144512 RepID=A0A0V0SWL1_9BILA|nr:hypothetical protein T05_7196 [Trichinella murrelli]KRX31041.1 hypothetical protein T05_13365 [Trichinella murrelli]KRX31096.1 hypothetical protein T05_10405 [Trichinella murrelli]KRX31332.1 hypothetical protein T05_1765 [Trichinella murrelli]